MVNFARDIDTLIYRIEIKWLSSFASLLSIYFEALIYLFLLSNEKH